MGDEGRLAPYVVELREFFDMRKMAYGDPEDLAGFAEALKADRTFADELGSMTRAVMYREGGRIGVPKLLELMTVAMGGARVAEAGEEVREPVRELLRFLSKAMRNGRPVADAEKYPDREAGADLSAPRDGMAESGDLEQTEEQPVQQHRHVATDFYSRAQEIEPLRVAGETLEEAEGEPLAAATGASVLIGAKDGMEELPSRWPGVLVGCTVAGLVVAAVLFVRLGGEGMGGTNAEAAVAPLVPAARAGESTGRTTGGRPAGSARPTVGERVVPSRGVRAGTLPEADGADDRAASEEMAGLPTGLDSSGGAEVEGSSRAVARSENGETSERTNMGSRTVPTMRVGPTRRMGTYTVSSGVMAANLISAPTPEYPRLAGMFHIEGQVILQAVVSRNGRVVATHVLRGHRLLRGAAADAVRQWRYRPYVVNGQATDVATIVTVNFRRR